MLVMVVSWICLMISHRKGEMDMERYLLLELTADGEWVIVYTFFNSIEAEQACKDMNEKYPNRSFSLKIV